MFTIQRTVEWDVRLSCLDGVDNRPEGYSAYFQTDFSVAGFSCQTTPTAPPPPPQPQPFQSTPAHKHWICVSGKELCSFRSSAWQHLIFMEGKRRRKWNNSRGTAKRVILHCNYDLDAGTEGALQMCKNECACEHPPLHHHHHIHTRTHTHIKRCSNGTDSSGRSSSNCQCLHHCRSHVGSGAAWRIILHSVLVQGDEFHNQASYSYWQNCTD